MDKVRESMPREELKKYGVRNNPNPPMVCVVRAIDDSTGELEVIAVTTSLDGKAPFSGRVPDGKGGKKFVSAVNGVRDPNCFRQKIGGRDNLISAIQPGKTLKDYRGCLHVTVHACESDPAVIAAKEKADKNVALYEAVMKRIKDERAETNGNMSGKATSLYQIITASNSRNEDPSAENVTRAKARGKYNLAIAINQKWDPSVSDPIPRLKNKKPSHWSEDDIDELLKRNGGTCLMNGYIISKFKDTDAYDAYQVDPGMTFEEKRNSKRAKGTKKKKMLPLPKRVKIE